MVFGLLSSGKMEGNHQSFFKRLYMYMYTRCFCIFFVCVMFFNYFIAYVTSTTVCNYDKPINIKEQQ